MTFKVGEVCIYVRPGSPYYGYEVTILSQLAPYPGGIDMVTGKRIPPGMGSTYEISSPSGNPIGRYGAYPEWLQKKKPPSRDIDRVTTWDEFEKKTGWMPRIPETQGIISRTEGVTV